MSGLSAAKLSSRPDPDPAQLKDRYRESPHSLAGIIQTHGVFSAPLPSQLFAFGQKPSMFYLVLRGCRLLASSASTTCILHNPGAGRLGLRSALALLKDESDTDRRSRLHSGPNRI